MGAGSLALGQEWSVSEGVEEGAASSGRSDRCKTCSSRSGTWKKHIGDVLTNHHGHIYVGIGDVTGHGLESGVLMLMAQTAIRTLIDWGETDPVAFLNTINRVLFQNIHRMGADRSLTLAMLNYDAGQLRITSQHEEILVVRNDGRIEPVDTINLGFPIGLVDDIREWITEARVPLDPGDGIVLYTDGITEAENPDGEFYGLTRLCAVISRHWRNSAAESVKRMIIEDLRAFISEAMIDDDVTLVIVKRQ